MEGLSDIETWLVPVGLVLLFLFGSYVIKRRANGGRLFRRLFLLLLGCIGLYLLVIKPNYKEPLENVKAHILSAHAEPSLDDSNVFNNVNDFLNSEQASRTDQVTIHGFGLSADELSQLSDYNLKFEATVLKTGITSIDVPIITENSSWTLKGKVRAEESSDEALPQGVILTINDKEHKGLISDGAFAIECIAPPAGTYLADIDVLTSSDTIREQTSITVLHEPTWNMLILSSYPTFEMNYLKNYWTSLGNGFAMRSKISKEKYQTSFSNAPVKAIEELSYRTVKQFDFIITDVSSWNDLSDRERRNILGVVSKEGNGLLIKPQGAREKAIAINHPQWSEAVEQVVSLDEEDIELINFPLSSSWGSISFANAPLAKYTRRGLGHIGVLSISDTYKLVLADQDITYQNLWSEIFSHIFVDFNAKTQILGNQWVWADERRTLQLYHPKQVTSPPVLNESTSLAFLEVPFLDNVIEVDAWPKAGYNQLSLGDGPAFSFYAHNKDSWEAKRQKDLYAINQMAANSSEGKEREQQFELKTISSFWWYALTLLGFCGLWLDERLYD